MDETPELTSITRNRTIRPLVAAWAFVIVILVTGFIWLSLSHDSDLAHDSDPASVDMAHDETTPEPESATGHSEDSHSEGLSHATPDHSSPSAHGKSPEGAQAAHDMPETPSQAHDTAISGHDAKMPHDDKASPIDKASPPKGRKSLAKAPIDGLFMMGANGPLPVLGPDSMLAWKEYAASSGKADDKPMIAIVITGIGLNKKATDMAITDLPEQIDMGFSPYGRNLQDWMNKGRKFGHEALLMIPTEPLKYPENDPGPHTLLAGAAPRDNLKKLDWLLSQVTGYVGVINEMGSKFTTSEEDLLPVLTDLNQRGLMFLDSRSTQFSIAAKVARQITMPRALNNLFIDNIINAAEINRNLTQLENTARTYGSAVGVAQAQPLTISQIGQWAKTLEARGFRLVPLTAVANRQPIR